MHEHLLVLLEPVVDPVPVERDHALQGRGRLGDRLRIEPGPGIHDPLGHPDRVVGSLALLRTAGVTVGGLEQIRADSSGGK
jgi:hypothetical protein